MHAAALSMNNETKVVCDILQLLKTHGAEGKVVDDSDTISIALERRSGWKLTSVILSRKALQGLIEDPSGSVKIDYLKKDLIRSAVHRSEYRYPRVTRRRALRSL
ncbi:MAG: hypothetical protein ABI718_18095 [Acidobacteriota bacterium]